MNISLERRQTLARSREGTEVVPAVGVLKPSPREGRDWVWLVGSEDHECEQIFKLGHEKHFQAWQG